MTHLLNWFRARRHSRGAAQALYAAVVCRARAVRFYAELGVPDTVDGRFDMIVLHMFMLLERLRVGGEPGRQLAQDLFDMMFRDMDRSLRELGVSDHAVGRRIKQMISAFYGRMQAYDQALKDPAALSGALRRNVYRQQAVEDAKVESLAEYVLAMRRQLVASPLRQLLLGRLVLAAADTSEWQESR